MFLQRACLNEDVSVPFLPTPQDTSIHPYFRSTNLDYKGSGYDRGHMAAAGNHRNHQKDQEETFVLSNMAPQVGVGFNRDSWNRLEKYVRGLTKKYDNVWVCTGPLYLPRRGDNGRMYVRYEVIGKNQVAVPTHFFKVLVAEGSGGSFDLEAYIMPNEPIPDAAPLEAFRVRRKNETMAPPLLYPHFHFTHVIVSGSAGRRGEGRRSSIL